MNKAVVLLALLCTACSSDPSGPLEQGSWGGEGVSLQVKSTGAHLEFDCATGDITELPVLDNGKFTANGTVTVGHGGPIFENEQPDVRSATYSGDVSGQHMTLDIAVGGSSPFSLHYELLLNAPPIIHRCL
jgi:hypothetical protein